MRLFVWEVCLTLMALRSMAVGVMADDEVAWPPTMRSTIVTEAECTVVASVPGEDRCLVGRVDGQILTVSLPSFVVAKLAKLEHCIQCMAVAPDASKLAVVTHDYPSRTVSVVLVSLSDGKTTTVDRRLVGSIVSMSNIQWSAGAKFFSVAFGGSGKTSPDWYIIDADNGKLIYEYASEKLSLFIPLCDTEAQRAIAFTSENGFYAFLHLSDRRTSVAYFKIEPLETTGMLQFSCRRVDVIADPLGAVTFFDLNAERVSVLMRDLRQHQHSVATYELEGNKLKSYPTAARYSIPEFMPASTRDPRQPLYGMIWGLKSAFQIHDSLVKFNPDGFFELNRSLV